MFERRFSVVRRKRRLFWSLTVMIILIGGMLFYPAFADTYSVVPLAHGEYQVTDQQTGAVTYTTNPPQTTGNSTGTGLVSKSSGNGSKANALPQTQLNWFDNMLLDAATAPIKGITQIFTALGFTIPNEIMRSFLFSNQGSYLNSASGAPAFGSANFSNIGDTHNQQVMKPFLVSFNWLAGMLMLLFIYISGIRISRASNSSIQRDRLKNELVGLFGAGVFLSMGPHLALAGWQIAFTATSDLLSMPAVKSVTDPLSGAAFAASLGAAPLVNLMNAIVGFVSAISAVVLAILVGFRGIFIDVWLALFPVAMVAYANEKMKPFFKMWWTEWIYQALIPVGQALIYALSAGMVSLFGASAKTGMGVEDIFTAITGVIAIFFAAATVRKLVDGVAASFQASSLGISSSGGAIGAAIGAYAGDRVGSLAVKGATLPYKKAAGSAFKKLDNSKMVTGMARKALDERPELAASHVANGGSLETYLQAHRMSGLGKNDPLHNADGMGIPDAANHGSRAGGGNIHPTSTRGSAHSHAMFRSHTADALRSPIRGAKETLASSNMAVVAKRYMADAKNGRMANSPEMGLFRDQVRETSSKNEFRARVSNLNGVYHPSTKDEPWSQYVGTSTNIDKYEDHMRSLGNAMKEVGVQNPNFREEMEMSFRDGTTPALYSEALDKAQDAEKASAITQHFEKASAYYEPMLADRRTIRAVESGEVDYQGSRDVNGRIERNQFPMTSRMREQMEVMANDLRKRGQQIPVVDVNKEIRAQKEWDKHLDLPQTRQQQTRERARNAGISI